MSESQELLIQDNVSFVYYMARKWSQTQSYLDLDELKSIAHLSLTKAAEKYDSSRAASFITYLKVVVENDFKKEYKKSQKYRPGLCNQIETEGSGAPCTYMQEPATDLHKLLSNLSERERMIVHMLEHGFAQQEIGDHLGCSKATVNNAIKEIRYYIRGHLN